MMSQTEFFINNPFKTVRDIINNDIFKKNQQTQLTVSVMNIE